MSRAEGFGQNSDGLFPVLHPGSRNAGFKKTFSQPYNQILLVICGHPAEHIKLTNKDKSLIQLL